MINLQPPVQIHLTQLPATSCPYLPNQTETIRAVMASSIDPEVYHAFMDAGFRRSGRLIYQPACDACQACVPLRVDVGRFAMSDSQKRCWRRNQDLIVTGASPELTDEKFDLYSRYVHQWHDRPEEADRNTLRGFLYDSPTRTIEFSYRDPAGALLAIGICDLSQAALSSVYFYFDPDHAKRSLGTFGALYELTWARERHLSHYYLGYWVRGCQAMAYKTSFRPYELLSPDGVWRGTEES
jgi:arginine-tRNA-protein transferase